MKAFFAALAGRAVESQALVKAALDETGYGHFHHTAYSKDSRHRQRRGLWRQWEWPAPADV